MYIPTGEELREARQNRSLTQAELADNANVSQPLIARIESEDVDSTLATIHTIVSALNNSQTAIEQEEIKLSLPSALKAARNRTGYTQGDLAEAADVSQPLISRIERDDLNPRVSTLRSLFEQLEPASAASDNESGTLPIPRVDSGILAEIELEFDELRNNTHSSTSNTESP